MAKIYEIDAFPYCPTTEMDCPYFSKDTGRCMMFKEENVLPYNECDNFFEEEEEEDLDADILMISLQKGELK